MTKAVSRTVKIVNRRGLHARASAKFVKTAARFDAAVTVAKDGMDVVGTSIMGLMLLAAAPGDSIQIKCEGRQAKVALEALVSLVADRFDED
ncbi:MAG: HPr family phosphocarrier protein [Alphaproteobacteria bacterium]|nr:MAG: HPr family phosphocarrier protein [Alphaproteobacteria bacterium]